jgi:hypothetical protein
MNRAQWWWIQLNDNTEGLTAMWRTQQEQRGRARLCPIFNMYYVSRHIPEEFLLGCNKFIYYNFSYVQSLKQHPKVKKKKYLR